VVDFEKRSMIKSKILADFIVEWTKPSSLTEGIVPEISWFIYYDRAWGDAGAGAATILISPSEIKLRYVARLQFNNEVDKYTNNIAEYEVILLGALQAKSDWSPNMHIAHRFKNHHQSNRKKCIAREPTLKRYLTLIKRMEIYFKGFTLEYNERSKNSEADELAKAAARNTQLCANVFFQVVPDASIKTVEPEPRVIILIESED
jgi:ribonuclease HI